MLVSCLFIEQAIQLDPANAEAKQALQHAKTQMNQKQSGARAPPSDNANTSGQRSSGAGMGSYFSNIFSSQRLAQAQLSVRMMYDKARDALADVPPVAILAVIGLLFYFVFLRGIFGGSYYNDYDMGGECRLALQCRPWDNCSKS